MAPHSSTPAWKIPWMEEPGRLQSMGSHTTEQLHFQFSLSCSGEGNGNPFQCSFLENPRDGRAWQAAVHGVAQSWTRLKRLSSSSRKDLRWTHPAKLFPDPQKQCEIINVYSFYLVSMISSELLCSYLLFSLSVMSMVP